MSCAVLSFILSVRSSDQDHCMDDHLSRLDITGQPGPSLEHTLWLPECRVELARWLSLPEMWTSAYCLERLARD
ncbi:hypothetical protein RRG08_046994 [Elysia crispata]|uniref:Uncharacterized protein n=1 Tax=Elysia crispata TaxID=231223 RepID=A0AAE1A8Y9_9GAST|nr:hypothetical protein RRG08_046994 [Elysia crispata]